MKIKIYETDQDGGGYVYDIWLDEDAEEYTDSDDGGLCTGSYIDALGMAYEQAKILLKLNKK